MTQQPWKDSLAAFFAERARQIGAVPTLEDLCYIAGRDPRIWLKPEVYEDLIGSILTSVQAGQASVVLEVGCASGFLAKGVAPRVGRYIGVDLAKPALQVARRLQLSNATFQPADGSRLPLADDSVDAAFCYDVFTNFPRFDDGVGIIADMLRVVKPGGRVLVGSIPNEATKDANEARAAEVGKLLHSEYGPVDRSNVQTRSPSLIDRMRRFVRRPAEPQIVCYYFRSEDFVALGERLGAAVSVTNIHRLNPYEGYRFNVVYTRRPA